MNVSLLSLLRACVLGVALITLWSTTASAQAAVLSPVNGTVKVSCGDVSEIIIEDRNPEMSQISLERHSYELLPSVEIASPKGGMPIVVCREGRMRVILESLFETSVSLKLNQLRGVPIIVLSAGVTSEIYD